MGLARRGLRAVAAPEAVTGVLPLAGQDPHFYDQAVIERVETVQEGVSHGR